MENSSLRNRAILIVSAFFGALSGALSMFILTWASSKYGAAAIGSTLLAGMIPSILLTLFSGTLADRLEPRRALAFSAVAKVLVLLIVAGVLVFYSSPIVFIIANLVLNLIGSLFGGSYSVIPPALFKEADLLKFNANINLTGGIAHLIGPVLAAGILAIGNTPLVFVSEAVLLTISGSLLLLLPRIPRPGSEDKLNLNFVLAGFKYVVQAPKVFKLIVFFAITNIFMAAYQVAVPIFSKNIGGATAYAALSTAMNLGVLISNILLSSVSVRATEAIIYTTSAFEGLSLLGLSTTKRLNTPFLAFGGLNDAMAYINGTLFTTWLQKTVPSDLLGRVFAAMSSSAMLLTPLGFVLAPLIIRNLGASGLIALLGFATLIISLIAILLLFVTRK